MHTVEEAHLPHMVTEALPLTIHTITRTHRQCNVSPAYCLLQAACCLPPAAPSHCLLICLLPAALPAALHCASQRSACQHVYPTHTAGMSNQRA